VGKSERRRQFGSLSVGGGIILHLNLNRMGTEEGETPGRRDHGVEIA
jgi:hypothetical protein